MSLTSTPVSAHTDNGALQGHTLEVALTFPDSGLAGKEQACLGLYPDNATDFSLPPLQARCLDPGEQSATFEGIGHGDYIVAVPGLGSRFAPDRYQGQLVRTTIPDEPSLSDFGIDVDLGLLPELAGATGKVQVNVYGCPPGTNGGGDATLWADECHSLAGGIPLSLSGTGSINDTAKSGVTGLGGGESGKVEFTNLPAGAYELGGELPKNAASPAVFIQSSIEGSVRPIAKDDTLAVRPAEVVAVDVYLVLDDKPAVSSPTPPAETTLIGFGNTSVTGGLTEAEIARMRDSAAEPTP
ncbi:MAG: hypothetical protein IT337_16995 [Thermomicrobiales bacterium]|nr:hypothetical protein [Thermomicrobiales bacterium]